jgi:hypothetical protein
MSEQLAHVLNAVQAARRIYQTAQPTAEQVGRVVQKIESGVLPRGPKGGATTTVEAVAEYLARRETARASAHMEGRSRKPSSSPKRAQIAVRHLYRELLTDYFFAVLMRRRTKDRSYLFRWSVAGTQAILLALALYAFAAVAAARFRQRVIPPQELAAQTWLASHFADVEVKSIKIASPSTVEATFSYRVNNRRIHSSLLLTLKGSDVVNVDSGD